MSSPERAYALLVQANPIPDPRAVPPVPAPALLDERRGEMLTREPTETRQIAQRPRWPRVAVAFAATIVIVGAAVGIWALTNSDDGPIAAGDAQIEVTFTGEEVGYTGDHEISPGRAELVFTNDWNGEAWIIVHRFDTGSAELAAELTRVPMGGDFVTTESPPGEVIFMEAVLPELGSVSGGVTRPLGLEAGSSYLIDVAVSGDESTHVWHAAVLEVVAE